MSFHSILTCFPDSSSKSDVTLNTSLDSANDVNQEDKWEPQTIEKGKYQIVLRRLLTV